METMAQEWISVKDRMPDDRQKVLAFLNHKPYKVTTTRLCRYAKRLEDVDEFDLGGYLHGGFYDSDSEYGYFEVLDVTHWMPLPEPPKEEA